MRLAAGDVGRGQPDVETRPWSLPGGRRLANLLISIAQRHAISQIRGTVDLKPYLAARQKKIDRALDRFLPKGTTKPATIHQAMRYSLFAGGKRLRPILCLAVAEACGGLTKSALPLACAIECIHTYSLIHDDLPSMDNDDFRRGRATCHKVYGEGIAILAGDALLTIAFEIAAAAQAWPRYDLRKILREIAIAAGSRKLIAGQVADLEGEGKKINRLQLRYIHENKTAALLTTSVRLGAMSANAAPTRLRTVGAFGRALGLAFQVIDDILDITQTSEKLGKSAGKDATAHKATYPAVLGLEKSRLEAGRLTRQAHNALRPLGKRGEMLHALADYLLEREY
jgi:geranylgeranyl diphosphate synthase type II